MVSKAARKRRIRIAAAIIIPLLLVSGAWVVGVIRFPVIEELTGFTPFLGRQGNTTGEVAEIEVVSPANGDTFSGDLVFTGSATPGSTVSAWVPGINIPVSSEADAGGLWTITVPEGAVSPGDRVMRFAANAGAWSEPVERTFRVSAPEAPEPQPRAWEQWANRLPPVIGTPILTIGRTVEQAVGAISIRVTQTGGGLQSDVDSNGVPDLAESTPIPPTSTNAIIKAPRYMNILGIVLVLVLPVAIVAWRRPKSFVEWRRWRTIENLGRQKRDIRRAEVDAKVKAHRLRVETVSKLRKEEIRARLKFAQSKRATAPRVAAIEQQRQKAMADMSAAGERLRKLREAKERLERESRGRNT